MPKFLLTVLILALLSLTGFGFVVSRLGPNQASSVILFLATFFLGFTSTLSLIFFFVHKKLFFRPKAFDAFGPVVSDADLRSLFRTSLRNAILLAVGAVALLVLGKLV